MNSDSGSRGAEGSLLSAPPMPEPRMLTASDDVALATYAHGPPASTSGGDYLFAHANGFCGGVWAPIISELSTRRGVSASATSGLPAVSFDLRGHGRSSSPSTSMNWDGHRADIEVVLDAYSMENPIGVGHSMGGASLLLAEQANPGTFSALWLYEPIVFPPRDEQPPAGAAKADNPLYESAMRRRDTFDSEQAAYDNFASKPPLNELSDESLRAYIRYGFSQADDGSVSLRCHRETEAQGYKHGVSHSAWENLPQVTCPVWVVSGTVVSSGPSAVAGAITDRLRNATLVEFDQLGHFGPLEDPGGIAEAIFDSTS